MKNRNWNIRDEETISEMMRLYNNLSGQFNPLLEEMTKNFDFTVAGLQWDEEVKKKLKDEKRPADSYNLIRTILNVIFSIEYQNRRKATANPRTSGDTEMSQMLTHTLWYFLYHSNFTRVQKMVFMDAIVAKFGVYYLNWSYEHDPNGSLIIESADPREFIFEPLYKDTLWSRSSYVMRKHSLSLEEILNKFALNDTEMQEEIIEEARLFFEQDQDGKRDKWVSKRLKALFSAVYETSTGVTSNDHSNLHENYLQWYDPTNGKFDVLELHEKRTERRLMIPDENRNKLVDITNPYKTLMYQSNQTFDGVRFSDGEAIDKVKESYGLTREPRVELENMRYVTASVPTFQMKVNEQPYPFKSDYYVYIPQYCYDLHADPLKAQSVIDDLKDPQAHFNKAQSLKLELLGRYANSGWIMDENAISGLEDDWKNNRIAPYRRVRAGYINQIKPEQHQTINPDLVRDPLEMQNLMQQISNASQNEVSGQDGKNVSSGRHFLAKERSQTKSFSFVLDNRDESTLAVNEMAMNFIKHFVRGQRIIRITQDVRKPYDLTLNKPEFGIEQKVDEQGNETAKIVQKIKNDISAIDYDIELSDEPYTATAQEEKFQKLTDFFSATLEVNPEKADAMLDIIAEEGNIPRYQEILERWEKQEGGTEQQKKLKQMMQQIQLIMAKLGVEEKKAEIAEKSAGASEGKADALNKQIEAKGKKIENLQKAHELKQQAKENALGMNKQNGNGKGKQPQFANN